MFMFHPYAPGSPFFLPHGAHIYNKLVSFMRSEYRARGYQVSRADRSDRVITLIGCLQEVITPIVYNQKLWESSGHWQHYKENMFAVRGANEEPLTEGEKKELMGLKPMNCPGHCLVFEHGSHSYRELPLRLADFGVLHRNEMHGALTGLTRVIRFQQVRGVGIAVRAIEGQSEMRCLQRAIETLWSRDRSIATNTQYC